MNRSLSTKNSSEPLCRYIRLLAIILPQATAVGISGDIVPNKALISQFIGTDAYQIGGDTVTAICTVIYKNIIPYIIKSSTIMILLGLVAMYLNGELALTPNKKKTCKSRVQKQYSNGIKQKNPAGTACQILRSYVEMSNF